MVSAASNPSRSPVRSASIAEVDAVVRSVLAAQEPRSQTEDRGIAVWADRLFALRHAEALAGSIREVRLAAETVVTPLARERLKARGVLIRRVAGAEAVHTRTPGEWGFAIEETAASGIVDALRRSLLATDWSELGISLDEAAQWVADGPERGALIVTDEASVAVWRACRREGVRAAAVVDSDAVARAVRSLGVNLIVIEPSGKSIYGMSQIGAAFRHGGAPVPPEGLDRGETEYLEGCRCGSPR